jgi:hypothetical protein
VLLSCLLCCPVGVWLSQYKLRMAAMGWFCGTLTCEQLSRLAVACWPYGMRLLFFANEIMQQCGPACSTQPKRNPPCPLR